MSKVESLEIIPMDKKQELTQKYMAMDAYGKLEFWKARHKNLNQALKQVMECINHYPIETSGLLIARGHLLSEIRKVEDRLQGAKNAITPAAKV